MGRYHKYRTKQHMHAHTSTLHTQQMVASTWLGDHQGRPSAPTNSLHKLHMARYQVHQLQFTTIIKPDVCSAWKLTIPNRLLCDILKNVIVLMFTDDRVLKSHQRWSSLQHLPRGCVVRRPNGRTSRRSRPPERVRIRRNHRDAGRRKPEWRWYENSGWRGDCLMTSHHSQQCIGYYRNWPVLVIVIYYDCYYYYYYY